MDQHIGLDVSLKDTSISVRQDGMRIWRGMCASDPKLLAEVIRKRAPNAKRVVFETGQPLDAPKVCLAFLLEGAHCLRKVF